MRLPSNHRRPRERRPTADRALAAAALLLTLTVALPAAAQDAAALVEQFKTASGDSQVAAIKGLIRQGPAGIPAVFARLGKTPAADDVGLQWVASMMVQSAAAGGSAARTRMAGALLREALRPGPAAGRRYALELVSYVAGAESVPVLASLLRDSDVGEMARWALSRVPGDDATKALIRALASTNGSVKAGVLNALAERRAERSAISAVPAITDAVKSPDESVRIAAIDALGAIPLPGSVTVLRDLLDTGSPLQRAHVVDAYLKLADGLLRTGGRGRIQARDIYKWAIEGSGSQLKAAGLLGLGRVGGTEAVGILIAALDNPAPDLRQAARTALVQASPDLQDALLDVLSTATPRTRRGILEVMGLRRDPVALPTLRTAARDSDPEIVAAAATALGTMRDQDSAQLLGELATRGPAPVRPVALRAYLNVMSAARNPNQVATGYEWGLRNATRDEERTQALRGLAGVGGPSALPALEPYLAAGPLQPEAIGALLGIADRLAAAGRKDNAVPLYRRALTLSADKGVRRRVASRLRGLGLPIDLAADEGFLTRWWALGPLPGRTRWTQEDAFQPDEAIDPSKPVRVEEKDYSWKAAPVTDPDGMLDLEKSVARQDDAVAYLYTEVTSPKAQDVTVKVGSDDGFVLWVNGRKAGEFKGDRPYAADSNTIAAHLDAGVNRILVKVTQGAGQWAAGVRLTSPGGGPLRLDQIKLP